MFKKFQLVKCPFSWSAFVSASNFVNDECHLVNVTLPETNASFNDLHWPEDKR